MSRFLYTIWPLSSHLGPQLGTALALHRRGHEVAFYTGESHRGLIENEGLRIFPFRALREELVQDMIQRVERHRTGWQAPWTTEGVFRRWYVETIPDQVRDLQDIAATWRPDVLVTETSVWAPFLVLRELWNIPVAVSSTLMACLLPGDDVPPWGPGLPPPRGLVSRVAARIVAALISVGGIPVRRRVNQIRASFGLPALHSSITDVTGRLPLYLVPSLRELDYNRRNLPDAVHYVGPCLWNKATGEPAPAWLDDLPTDVPWVHVTEGTAHFQDPFILRAAAQGLANRPVEAILTTGRHREPASVNLGPAAPNVHVEQWVNHTDLLARCAVVVTSGGAGTVMAALKEGVPLVIVPTHWDKPDNAQRIAEAGVGLRLAPHDCTPRGLWAAVERILNEPHFRERARAIARQLESAPGPSGAADLLEHLIPNRTPSMVAST